MLASFIYYAALVFEGIIGVFGVRLYEEPGYEVLGRVADRVEIRRYGPRVAAEVEMPDSRVALHRIRPELFGGYVYDSRVEGFVAPPEKALFDVAYLAAVNRSRVSGSLPETDLKGLRWSEARIWLRRIRTPRIRAALERALRSIREQHAATVD